ncbi:MAG: hypothetical protein K2Q32_06130 [Alphaproteobacteria bacterium]|nr:hypothetical protein [Alphaproteobacteria bacterium]
MNNIILFFKVYIVSKHSAKATQKLLEGSKEEKLSILAELLEQIPLSRKKLKYGEHFSVALKLFESLVNDDKALDETIKYLERQYLLDSFRKACLLSFEHVEREFVEYTAPLKKLTYDNDLDAHRQYNKESHHSLNKLERLTVAASFVRLEEDDLSRFIHRLREFRNTRRRLNAIFKQDNVGVKAGKRPTQFQLAQLQARRNQRRGHATHER